MDLSCPACSRKLMLEEQCPRCGCDILPLQRIISTADYLYIKSANSLPDNPALACQSAVESWSLVHDQRTAQAAFIACLLTGDRAQAEVWWLRLQ